MVLQNMILSMQNICWIWSVDTHEIRQKLISCETQVMLCRISAGGLGSAGNQVCWCNTESKAEMNQINSTEDSR